MKKNIAFLILSIIFIQIHSLEFIGNPLTDYSPDAAKIIQLQTFGDKLYLGFGDATINTGETDIISYSPKIKKFNIEGRVQDEAISQYCIIDSFLIIPGVDATESWDFGNIYFRSPTKLWEKKRTIPNGIHIFDAVEHNGYWFIGTGNFFSLNDKDKNAFGGIFVSDDKGSNWSLSYATPSDLSTTYRIKQVFKVGNELYATFYGYTALEKIPEDKKEMYKDVPKYENYYLSLRENLFLNADLLHYKEGLWILEDNIEIENLAYSKVIPLGNKAIFITYSGKTLPYQQLFKNAKRDFFLMEEDKVSELELPFDNIIDYCKTKNENLFLVKKDDLHYIAKTENLENWELEKIDSFLKFTTIEILNDKIYLGEKNGNIYRLNSDNDRISYTIQAENFIQGKKYDIAITKWNKIWEKIILETSYTKNEASFQSTNIKEFYFQLPEDHHKEFNIILNKFKYEITLPEGVKSLKFIKDEKKWTINKINEKIDSLSLKEPILFEIKLPEDVSNWQKIIKSKAVQNEANSQIAIVGDGFKGLLEKDKITYSDLLKINYNNKIFEIQISGKQIKELLERSTRAIYFSSEFENYKDLVDEKIYSVATTNYFYENNFSKIKYKEIDSNINKAMIKYLQK